MPVARPRKSLADYLVIAISPALIMALVGSLVFFLLEILYSGRYYAQLQWILFFFVFGAVLVARISMQADIADRAGLYAAVLGLLTWLAIMRFVEYPPEHPAADWAWAINLALIGLIWWCAHRLTWDCTLVNDAVDASGAGLLELTGLAMDREHEAGKAPTAEPPPKKDGTGLDGWWQRYRRYREAKAKKPHAPGIWVVYFSLAALPLYGLGQTQIPPEEPGRRSHVFRLLLVYAASGLGLLLTTCFLGLRRYLRQRNLRMPATMTGAWLFFGGAIIAAMLLLAAVLPRPGAVTPLLSWTGLFDAPDLTPSQHALRTNRTTGDDEGKARPGGEEDTAPDDKDKGKQDRPRKEDPKKGLSKSGQQKGNAGRAATKEGKRGPRQPSSPDDSTVNKLAKILKWIVLAIIVLLIAFLLLRAGLRFLANFTHWARRLLAALQAWWLGLGALFARGSPTAEADTPAATPPPEWSSFRDPFLTGEVDGMSAARLLRYSYEALEAWARDRDIGRQPRETPLEFADRLAGEFLPLAKHVRRLAGWYARLAYAGNKPPAVSRDALREFWYALAEVPEAALESTHEAVHQ